MVIYNTHHDYRSGGRLMLANFRSWEAKRYLREAEQSKLQADAHEAAGDHAGAIQHRAKCDVAIMAGRESLRAAKER